MRILICSNIYPPNFIGGAELIAHYQAKQLVAAGHEVQVFTGDTSPGGHRYAMRTTVYDGLTVHRIRLEGMDYHSNFVNFFHPRVEQHFSQCLTTFHPDVVHCHNIIGLSVKLLCIAREFGAKVVLTLHDHWGFCFKNTIMKEEGIACSDYSRCDECQPCIDDVGNRRIPMRMRQDYMRLALGAVDAFVSPSQYLADTYVAAGLPPDKIHVVWNGIDVDKIAAIDRKSSGGVLRFSFFGYFGRHKGVHTLLSALPLLKDRQRVRINLIGDGDQILVYKQQLRENGCANLVKFWGKLDNTQVGSAYAKTDVLVLPSIWRENQPVSITEAMACGIPVIASNMGGIPELVQDGVTGFIFEAGNPADLAEKMDRLIADPVLVKNLGRNGQERIRKNSFARQVEKVVTIYREGAASSTSSVMIDPTVIVCSGQQIYESCHEAIGILPHYLGDSQPCFVMAEWLTQAQLQQASLAWLVDDSFSPADVGKLAGRGLPLLVSERNATLVAMCRKYRCGLYYHDAHEAASCIAYLLTHPSERATIARNAQSARIKG